MFFRDFFCIGDGILADLEGLSMRREEDRFRKFKGYGAVLRGCVTTQMQRAFRKVNRDMD